MDEWTLSLTEEVIALWPRASVGQARSLSVGALLELVLAVCAGDAPSVRLRDLRVATRVSVAANDQLVVRTDARGVYVFFVREQASARRLLLSAKHGLEPRVVNALSSSTESRGGRACDLYLELERAGVDVPVVERCFTAVTRGVGVVEADVVQDERVGSSEGMWVVSPVVLSSALWLARSACQDDPDEVLDVWPVCIEEIEVIHAHAAIARVCARRATAFSSHEDGFETPMVQASVALLDDAGDPVALMHGVRFGRVASAQERDAYALRPLLRAAVSEVTVLDMESYDDGESLLGTGASSLDLMRLVSTLGRDLGDPPALESFFADPSLRALAELFARGATTSASNDAPKPAKPEDPEALTFTELQHWYLEEASAAPPAYNEGIAFMVRGALDLAALEGAFRALEEAHPALRTVFPLTDAKPMRRRAPPGTLQFRAVDVTDESGPLTLERAQELCREHLRERFAITERSSLRAVVLRLGADAHLLLIVAHHIVCDAWSLAQVLLPDLAQAYAGRELRPVEERARLPAARAEDLTWWRSEFDGVPLVLDLPTDRVRPPVQSHAGARASFVIDEDLWRRTRELASSAGATVFSCLLAAYELMLERHSGQSQFCVGIPVSLREGAAADGILGCFVQVCPLRADVSMQRAPRAFVREVHRRVAGVLAHRHTPFPDLVRELRPERSTARNALVQVVFSYRTATPSFRLGDALCTPMPVHTQTSKFDLTLEVHDHGQSGEATFEYATDLFDASTVERWAARFRAVLEALTAEPDQMLLEHRLFGSEHAGALAGADHPKVHLDLPHTWLETMAAYGAAPALFVGGTHVSYATLALQARQVQQALADAGIARGETVALCLPRGAAWVVAVLAVVAHEAVYLPIDLGNPRRRIVGLLERSGVRAMLTTETVEQALFARAEGRAIEVCDLTLRTRDGQPRHAVAEELVYGICTSGSTGEPKIASVTRAGFDNLLAWYERELSLTAEDRVLVLTSVGFDLTQKNVFGSLRAGAELHLYPDALLDPVRVLELIEAHAITVINCTPTLMYMVIEACAGRFEALVSLRSIVLGGEPMDTKRLRAFFEHPACRARLLNSYGPSECADVVAACWIDPRSQQLVPLGAPIPNVTCHVVDDAGRSVPEGVPGELWLSGVCVGAGYMNDGDKTSAVFVQRHDESGIVYYRTGDRVRVHDGALFFLGRIDGQRKLRGYRIELGEIEAVLGGFPEVRASAANVVQDASGRERLVAYVVPRRPNGHTSEAIDLRALRTHLVIHLPSYMVPSTFVVLAELPLTPSGKLDRRALPIPSYDDASVPDTSSGGGLEALGAELLALLALWRRVLGAPALQPDDDFFEAGGHSLLAMELVSAIQRELATRVPLLAVFTHPTARGLLGFMQEHRAA